MSLSKEEVKSLSVILSVMSDDDIDKAIQFHRDHLDQLLIQKKVRREEKKS